MVAPVFTDEELERLKALRRVLVLVDGRPGRMRDAVAEVWSRRREQLQLRADLTSAAENGEPPAGVDTDQALFESVAAGLALNAAMRLQHDRAAAARARRALERALDRS
ncbi:hypothetical protein ABZ851_16340 [Streptomyces sp. NPDC047049]|uniref:TetR family transcriptional regulator C-terminal domain-containing protein n=1 Tax=Streptomyces sp. NPDC047049 TaxID=3156688 RepID=UPI00340E0FBE